MAVFPPFFFLIRKWVIPPIRQENEGSKGLNKRCLDVEFARETGEDSVTGPPQVHH